MFQSQCPKALTNDNSWARYRLRVIRRGPTSTTTPEQVVASEDEAMYQAKRAGQESFGEPSAKEEGTKQSTPLRVDVVHAPESVQ